MSRSVERIESPSSAGADDEATSMPVSGGASTARDEAELGGAQGVGAASSLPSALADCSRLSAPVAGAATRDIEVDPTAGMPWSSWSWSCRWSPCSCPCSSVLMSMAAVVAASLDDGVAVLRRGGVVAASAQDDGAASRPPCISRLGFLRRFLRSSSFCVSSIIDGSCLFIHVN